MMKSALLIAVFSLLVLNACASPLRQAAVEGDTATTILLLNQGADPNESTWGYAPPLFAAVYYDHVDTAHTLLEKGADVNKTYMGLSPLIWAVKNGNAQMVQLLLEKGADIEYSLHGMTALEWARKDEQREIIHLLKKAEVAKLQAAPVESRILLSDVDHLPVTQALPKKNAYAVIVGIEQYRKHLPRADFASRDAQTMGQYATKVLGYQNQNVTVLLNENATKADLEKYLETWLPNNVEAGGSVFIFYSGHGAPNPKTGDAYLVPYDGDPAYTESTTYSMKRLYTALEKLPAKEIIVILDSCFSGAGGRSVLAAGARPMVISVENPLIQNSKTMILAASTGDQIASTYEEKGHGLLTYFFLKGLQGDADANHDGTIDIRELYEYVQPHVVEVARKQYNNQQTPQFLAAPDLVSQGGARLVELGKRQ